MWFSSETSQGMSIGLDQLREGGQHGGRPAADDLGGAIASLQAAGQQIGDEAAVPGSAVVGRQLDLDARRGGSRRRPPGARRSGRRRAR